MHLVDFTIEIILRCMALWMSKLRRVIWLLDTDVSGIYVTPTFGLENPSWYTLHSELHISIHRVKLFGHYLSAFHRVECSVSSNYPLSCSRHFPLLRNSKAYYSIHRRPTVDSVLRNMNAVETRKDDFLKIHSNIPFLWNKLPKYSFHKERGWSRVSVLAFSIKVRGFKPGRSRRIFRAKKSSARLPSEK